MVFGFPRGTRKTEHRKLANTLLPQANEATKRET
jgi:hypothetical protein